MNQRETIGTGFMEDDGTLVLELEATDGNTIGSAVLRYPVDHPQYQQILSHLSPIVPGQKKPVEPWPD